MKMIIIIIALIEFVNIKNEELLNESNGTS